MVVVGEISCLQIFIPFQMSVVGRLSTVPSSSWTHLRGCGEKKAGLFIIQLLCMDVFLEVHQRRYESTCLLPFFFCSSYVFCLNITSTFYTPIHLPFHPHLIFLLPFPSLARSALTLLPFHIR